MGCSVLLWEYVGGFEMLDVLTLIGGADVVFGVLLGGADVSFGILLCGADVVFRTLLPLVGCSVLL